MQKMNIVEQQLGMSCDDEWEHDNNQFTVYSPHFVEVFYSNWFFVDRLCFIGWTHMAFPGHSRAIELLGRCRETQRF